MRGPALKITGKLRAADYLRLARVHGPMCAAWLVREFRDQMHMVGGINLVMPRNKETPGWFRLAMISLKGRPHVWVVREISRADDIVYQLRWRHWVGWVNGRVTS